MKYLYFGNMGNKGANFCEHAKGVGEEVRLLFAPLQNKRCRLKDFYGDYGERPAWADEYEQSKITDLLNALVLEAPTADYVIATGAFEAAQLIRHEIPFYWFVSGGELSEAPFRNTQDSINYRSIIEQGRPYIRRIISNHNDVKFACRLLGLSDRLLGVCDVPYILPEFRERATAMNHLKLDRICVASYTRRVYSGGVTHSKGTEVMLSALRILKECGLDQQIDFRFTLDGPDARRFKCDIDSLELKNVSWLGSLTRYDFAKELATHRPIVLDQFAERESVLSGIIREGIAFGCPVLCDNVYYDGFADNLGNPVPVITVRSPSEIAAKIEDILVDPGLAVRHSKACSEYASKYFNSAFFMNSFRRAFHATSV